MFSVEAGGERKRKRDSRGSHFRLTDSGVPDGGKFIVPNAQASEAGAEKSTSWRCVRHPQTCAQALPHGTRRLEDRVRRLAQQVLPQVKVVQLRRLAHDLSTTQRTESP